MKLKNYLLITLLTVAYAGNDNVGTSAMNFLKIGVGGKGEAMGGAYVAQVNDVSSLFWNPAGLAKVSTPQFMVSNTQWLLDITHTYVGIGWPISSQAGTLGLSILSLQMPDLEETKEEASGKTGRKFPAGDVAIGVGYARNVSDRFSFGVHGKFVQETISFSKASTFAIDVGTLYKVARGGLKIGMAVSNFGRNLQIDGADLIWKRTDPYPDLDGNPNVNSRLETADWPLPITSRFGISVSPIGPEGFLPNNRYAVNINVDYFDPRDTNPYYNLGAEFNFLRMISVRAGITNKYVPHFEYDSEDQIMKLVPPSDNFGDKFKNDYDQLVSFGFGIEQKIPFSNTVVEIDYSYSEMDYFNGIERVTIALKF